MGSRNHTRARAHLHTDTTYKFTKTHLSFFLIPVGFPVVLFVFALRFGFAVCHVAVLFRCVCLVCLCFSCVCVLCGALCAPRSLPFPGLSSRVRCARYVFIFRCLFVRLGVFGCVLVR